MRALPPGVPQPLAQSIEFVGRAVRLLRAPAGAFRGRELLPHTDTLESAAALGTLQVGALSRQDVLLLCVCVGGVYDVCARHLCQTNCHGGV